ncbi:DUF2799 domain-containing protein [Reinekea marina]|uniref:DUF2799 domain-containing protein n=1 Tax=Reinekea marina TaxID=1310421 RepID=A0ABV7WQA2_9GAMM|nr:DUF2799 domain-containing protein [Reinekea marina]MDN3648619.1 DUF2799 domain-containing protein [Reinekea marina]
MNRIGIAFIATMLVLSGCATLSEDECLTADWYQIGYEDGARGYPDTRIASHREACAKHGVAPQFRDYLDGHSEGVLSFCTPRNGFVQGQKGYQYTGICPPSIEGEFLDSYQAGREIYSVRSVVSSLQSEQRSNENRISSLKQALIDAEAAMFAATTPEEERRNIYNSIGQMQEELGGLEERNKQLIVEIAQAQAQLRILEEKYAYY